MYMMTCGKSWWQKVSPGRRLLLSMKQVQRQKKRNCSQRCVPGRCAFSLDLRQSWGQAQISRTGSLKLQVAIDRTDLETAEAMIEEIKESADIIEIGTSLIKDYGLDRSVAYFRKRFPEQCFLADIKTCDEGAYEFRKTYE